MRCLPLPHVSVRARAVGQTKLRLDCNNGKQRQNERNTWSCYRVCKQHSDAEDCNYKQCNEEDDSCSEEKNKDKKVKSWWVKSTAGEVLAECFVCWEQCPEVQIPMSATHYNPKCDAPSVTGYKKKLEWNVKAMMSLPRHLLNVLPYKTSTRWQTCQSGMTALILGCLVKVDPLGSDEDGCIVGVLGGRPPGERRYDTIVSHTTTPGQDKGGGAWGISRSKGPRETLCSGAFKKSKSTEGRCWL